MYQSIETPEIVFIFSIFYGNNRVLQINVCLLKVM